jgi:tRNA(Ile)-lysidine synthase
VRAIHIDHGWEASARLGKAAQAIADQLGLSLELVPVSLAEGPSPEGVAREARLEALEAAAGVARIVTGHHADDSAETVVGNLLRGTGITGLSGIPAQRDRFRRPFLAFRRMELRRLAEALELPFVDDPANEDLQLRRNLIRHRVIPELDEFIDGDVVELLGRAASHLAATDSYLDGVTMQMTIREDEGALLVPVAPLLTEPQVLAARAVRDVLRRAHPPYPGTARDVAAVFAVASRQSLRADLSGGWIAEAEGPYVALYEPVEAAPPDPAELPVPGEVAFGRHVIAARRVADGRKLHLSTDRARIAISAGLQVRAAQPGDRIRLRGGSKSVADALGEAAVPRRRRSAWPVVESRARIAWIPGVRVATWAREQSANDIWVELERRSA